MANKADKDAHNKDVRDFFSRESYHKESVVQEKEKELPQPEIVIDQYGEQRFEYPHERSLYFKDNPESVLAKWTGPEYETYEQSQTWYLVITLILIGIILYAIFTNSPVMALVFILIGVVGYIYINTPPRVMDFGITYDGIVMGNKMYAYDDLESFWIFYEPPHTRVISIRAKGLFVPYIHIPLHQIDPVGVREVLMQFVPEKKQEPGLIDAMERMLHL